MNWKYDKHKWYISWYNLDNMPEYSYEKKYGRKDITDKGDKDWRKIFNFRYYVEYKQDYGDGRVYSETEHVGLQWVNEYSETSITWIGKNKIYRLYFRYAPTWKEKGKWKLKYESWRNDHTNCG
jgi:hypothetical protein